jgi:tetratricopeptide (TPR) repeat protein
MTFMTAGFKRPGGLLAGALCVLALAVWGCGGGKQKTPVVRPAKPPRQTTEEKRQQDQIYHYEQAIGRMKEGLFVESEKEFRESLNLLSTHVESLYGLGLALMQQERYAEAVPSFEQAMRLFPAHWDSLLMKGVCQDKMGEPEKAVETYKTGLASRVPRIVGMSNYYLGLIQLRDGEHEKAYYSFSRAMADAPDYVPAYAKAAEALEMAGRHAEALDLYLKAVEKEPKSPEYHYKAALMNFRLNRVDEARRLFEKTLALAPNSEWGQKAFDLLKLIPKAQ